MKRLFVLLIALMLLLSTVTGVAYAEDTKYILIENNSTNLYADAACTDLLCTLPASYYAQCKSENETSYEVVFAGATGYIKKSTDVPAPQVDALVSSDYSNMVSKLSQSKTTQITKLLDVNNYSTKRTVDADTNFTYIGKINKEVLGELTPFYYVRIGNDIGLFKASDLPPSFESSIPTYTKPTPTPSATVGASATASANQQSPESTNGLVRILLIIGICIPAVVIVYLLFKPAKAPDARYTGDEPKRNDRNDDDDYYR